MKTASLAFLVTLVTLQSPPLPYAGSWKILLPKQDVDVGFWIVNVSPDGKSVKLVSGLNQFARSKILDVKADQKSLQFTLDTGAEKLRVTMLPPQKDEAKLSRGSLQNKSTILPIWVQRTSLEELTSRNASRESPGYKKLQSALQKMNLEDRRAKLDAILKEHAGEPVHFLTLQAMFGILLEKEAKPEEFREVVNAYRRLAERHGELFLLGANLDLTRNLFPQKASQPAAVDSAREALKLLRPDHPESLRMGAYLMLAEVFASTKTDAPEMRTIVEQLGKVADNVQTNAKTPREAFVATGNLANTLIQSPVDAVIDLGLQLARRTVQLIPKDATALQRETAYRLLVAGLKKRGLLDEIDELAPTLKKIEEAADAEYEKDLFSFRIDPVKERTSGAGRTVLVELFTNAPNRQVFAATMAFDAARKTYSPKDVVFLQYHVAYPDLDALLFPDGETRKLFYQSDLEGLPAVFVDGKMTEPLGGAKQRGKNSYQQLRTAIDKARTAGLEAKLSVAVSRRGETITVKANVTDLARTGAHVRLRFALVEEQIRYQGTSGVRLHHHVVRAFVGGALGQRLDKREVTHSASLNLAQLRITLNDYLDGLAKKIGVRSPTKPVELNNLKVIAWIQDENSKQVLGATQADVPTK